MMLQHTAEDAAGGEGETHIDYALKLLAERKGAPLDGPALQV